MKQLKSSFLVREPSSFVLSSFSLCFPTLPANFVIWKKFTESSLSALQGFLSAVIFTWLGSETLVCVIWRKSCLQRVDHLKEQYKQKLASLEGSQ